MGLHFIYFFFSVSHYHFSFFYSLTCLLFLNFAPCYFFHFLGAMNSFPFSQLHHIASSTLKVSFPNGVTSFFSRHDTPFPSLFFWGGGGGSHDFMTYFIASSFISYDLISQPSRQNFPIIHYTIFSSLFYLTVRKTDGVLTPKYGRDVITASIMNYETIMNEAKSSSYTRVKKNICHAF